MWVLICLLLLLFFFIACVIWLLFLTPFQINCKKTRHFPFVKNITIQCNESLIDMQIQMLEHLTSFLSEKKILFWAVRDSLLALMQRKQEFFGQDHITFAILQSSTKTLEEIVQFRKEHTTFHFSKERDFYRLAAPTIDFYPFIAIYIMQEKKHEIVTCTPCDQFGDYAFVENYKHRNHIYLTKHVFPVKPIDVSVKSGRTHITLYLPNDAEK